ncbi:MAG: hypothetical protein ABFD97_10680 [Syntrophobacter sp.]
MYVLLRNVLCSIIVGFVCSLLLVSQCHAGAWTQAKGKFYERFGVNRYFTDEQFDSNGNKEDFPSGGKYSENYLSNYIEYGLTDRITLINALYYKAAEKKDNETDVKADGLGDVDLGAKFKLYDGRLGVFSVQGLTKIPGDYDSSDTLPLGAGQYDFEVRLLYGLSLYRFLPGYCNFEIAHRWRMGDPADEIRYLIEFGVDITKRLYGRVKLDGTLSMNNGNKLSVSGNPTVNNNFDLGKLDTALGYRLTDSWMLEVGYTPEIYGRNTSSGATYSLAIAYQFK